MSDLYVMQNECGLIKIGRSHDIEGRRRALQSIYACKIDVVAVIVGGWNREEAIHIALNKFRLIGEWFKGSDEAKEAIIAELSLGPELSWPYNLESPEIVEDWLAFVEGKRFLEACNKQFNSLIREMVRSSKERRENPGFALDGHIWHLMNRFGPVWRGSAFVERNAEGKAVLMAAREDGRSIEFVPNYTLDIRAALQVWPDNDRPLEWPGSAWECCIEGLRAQKANCTSRIRIELGL